MNKYQVVLRCVNGDKSQAISLLSPYSFELDSTIVASIVDGGIVFRGYKSAKRAKQAAFSLIFWAGKLGIEFLPTCTTVAAISR